MKSCNYCGKANEDATLFCVGCGTAFDVPKQGSTPSISAQKNPPGTLNAKIATIILLAYLAVQLFCGAATGATANVIAAGYGIHNLRQIYAISDTLEPITMFLTYLLGGMVIIFVSFKLIPKYIKDTSPNGAAWVLGRWRTLVAALVIGLIVGACARFLYVLKPHATYNDLGPLTRMALTPGLPQNILVVVAVLLAPLVEEMLFRGVLYGGYRKSFGPSWAIVFTTLLFVIGHIPQYIHFPPGIIGAVIEALVALWCRLRWGAIGPAIAVHVGFNFISALIVICK
jgi:membrane protease YdiL (CAAX protease family)